MHLSSKMCSLDHLELSLCDKQILTDIAVVDVSTIQTLKMLKLDGHWDVSEQRTMSALTRNYNNYTMLSSAVSCADVTWEAIKAIRAIQC